MIPIALFSAFAAAVDFCLFVFTRAVDFVIRGYTKLLQRTEDKDCLKRGIKLMEEASHKLENTVNGFVELMDIYTLLNPEKKFLSLNSEIDNVAKNLNSLKENIGPIITKNFNLKEKLFFNDSYLTTILTSLIDNAVRHNIEQENLEITVTYKQMANDSILLAVEDNGKGVDLLL